MSTALAIGSRHHMTTMSQQQHHVTSAAATATGIMKIFFSHHQMPRSWRQKGPLLANSLLLSPVNSNQLQQTINDCLFLTKMLVALQPPKLHPSTYHLHRQIRRRLRLRSRTLVEGGGPFRSLTTVVVTSTRWTTMTSAVTTVTSQTTNLMTMSRLTRLGPRRPNSGHSDNQPLLVLFIQSEREPVWVNRTVVQSATSNMTT